MRVLLVKLSSLGDVVHTLAAAMDMQRCVPGVQIDWVVEQGFAPLLALCPAVQRVIPVNLRQWRKSWWRADTRQAWRGFVQDLQRERYDAVIDAQGLTKSALVARLARLTPGGHRYALAQRTDGSAYEAPTRWVADRLVRTPLHVHAQTRARLLCAQALGYDVPAQLPQVLVPSAGETAVPARTLALVHGTSRADKCWPESHWVQAAQQWAAQGWSVALVQGSAAEAERAQRMARAIAGAQVWPLLSLSQLAQRLADCAGVVGVDSGVSHIAVALGKPHVQLYNFDTAWRTGPLDCAWQRSVFAHPTPSVQEVTQAWDAVWQARSDAQVHP